MSKHRHPVNPGSATVVEKIVTATAAGSEGCAEHYNERTIVTDANYEEHVTDRAWLARDYARAIVLGEALSEPLCKKRFGRRK